jgi:hypothetical protein
MYEPEGFYLGAVARTADAAKAGGAAASVAKAEGSPKGTETIFRY